MISSECARRTLVRPDMIEVVCESQGWTCMHAACSPFAAACALVADAGKACVGRSRRVNIFPATVNSNIKMRETESPRLASYTPARCSAWFTMQADLAKPQAGSMAVVFLIEMAAGPSQKAIIILATSDGRKVEHGKSTFAFCARLTKPTSEWRSQSDSIGSRLGERHQPKPVHLSACARGCRSLANTP